MKRIIVILMAGVVSCLPTPVRADDPHPLRPNLRIFQEQMRMVADSVFAAIPSPPDTTCRYTVHPAVACMVPRATRHSMLHAPTDSMPVGVCQRTTGRAVRHRTVIGRTYENARRTWFFGEQIVDRCVALAGSVKVVEQGTGTILVARSFTSSVRDTVPVVSLESLETPGIPATHGSCARLGSVPFVRRTLRAHRQRCRCSLPPLQREELTHVRSVDGHARARPVLDRR